MSLAMRIIPCLDVHAGRVVKGTQFLNLKDAGDPVQVAQRYNQEGADELVFLDITASSEKRPILLEVVRQTAEQVFIPLTVGGGIQSLEDIRILLNAGADKISMNTTAVQNPKLITQAAERFGSQCIVVAVDVQRKIVHKKLDWEVYIHGGRTPTGLFVRDWVKKAEQLGAGEILLTSMDGDGTKNGFDCELLQGVSTLVSIPVIASGGAGCPEHFKEAYQSGASACLAD